MLVLQWFVPKSVQWYCKHMSLLSLLFMTMFVGQSYCRYVYESKEEYDAEIPAIAEVLSPLVVKCRDLGRAMRIGTNHGE
jgi:hypothetical protein